MGNQDSQDCESLIRLLHGELAPAEAKALSARLEREPALLAQYRWLERAWMNLGSDPTVLPRPGFSTSVMARARSASSPSAGLQWSFAPAWAKVAAILALLVGAALGSSLALSGVDGRPDPAPGSDAMIAAQLTLAESYETALQSPSPGSDDDQEGRP